jgi:hypothetical protein
MSLKMFSEFELDSKTIHKPSFCRFLGSFEPIFDPFCRGVYQTSYIPPQKGSKIGQKIPKIDEALVCGQSLRFLLILADIHLVCN